MKIIECPHCHCRVVPRRDGLCPSCEKNPDDMRGTNAEMTLLDIAKGWEMPNVCVLCGRPTDEIARLSILLESPPSKSSATIPMPFSLGLLPLLVILIENFFFKPSFRIGLPFCKHHSKKEIPQPAHVDSNLHRATFLVHRGFKVAYASRKHSVKP